MLAEGALVFASCCEIARRRVFVVSAGFWDSVWSDSTQKAVAAAENKPV